MTEAFTSIMAYGYIFIVGFVFVLVVLELLSFFAAGKITGSINDEFMSAFTLFGAMFFISMVTGLINAVMSILLTGYMIPAIAAFVLYLGLSIFAVMRIYDLSGGKSFLFLILSFLITAVVTGLLAYGAFKFLPSGGLQLNTDTGAGVTDDANLETDFGTESGSDIAPATDVAPATDIDAETEASVPSGPKLPSAPAAVAVGSHESCSDLIPCQNPGYRCLENICQSSDEFAMKFPGEYGNCNQNPCENCISGKLKDFSIPLFTDGDTGKIRSIDICVECDSSTQDCKTGFTCKDYRCITQ